MGFDMTAWIKAVAGKLGGWRETMSQAGATSVYAYMAAMTLAPVVAAAHGGDVTAGFTLMTVLSGVGTNLIANMIQGWKDRTDAPSLTRDIAAAIDGNAELRTEIDMVMKAVGTVDLAARALSDEDRRWFQQTLGEELQKLGNLGQYQATLVGAGLIVRDNYGTINIDVHTNDSPSAADSAERLYLTKLAQRCNILPLGAMGGEVGVGDEVTLDKVFISLDTTARVKLTEQEKKDARGADDRPVSAMEVATENERLVLLGNPGSGKSSFVRQLTAQLALARLGKGPLPDGWQTPFLPLFVTLGDLTPKLATIHAAGDSDKQREDALVKAVRSQWQADLEDMKVSGLDDRFEEALTAGNVLLVFDGLDEVAAALRSIARDAVCAVLRAYPRAKRAIITCRIRSYTDDAAFRGFPSFTLSALDDVKIQWFVKAWYAAQAEKGLPKAGSRADDLSRALKDRRLGELAENPMLLTCMAIVHQQEKELPKQRVCLYSLIVDVLLKRWQRYTGADVPDAVRRLLDNDGDQRLRCIVQRLAYEAHDRQSAGEKETRLPRNDLLTLLEAPEYLGDAGFASDFLDYIDQRAGVFVGHGGDDSRKPHEYSFPHRTFQEYLAGCHMVDQRGREREYWRRAANGDTWTVAAQLGAEELLFNNPQGRTQALDLAYDLCGVTAPRNVTDWRCALWSGHIGALATVREIERDDEKPGGGVSYLQRVRKRLVGVMRESPLPPIDRAEAGRTLAKLGDPRKEVTTVEQMAFCLVPAGPFLMGTEKSDWEDERPQRELVIPYDYWISQFPVTNAQFRQFVDAGGYGEAHYWAEAAKAGVWTAKRVKGRFDGASRVGAYEFGEPYNLPNHPVVGVTWYEALAFTRWLEDHARLKEFLLGDWQVCLPSEAEWEKAARGGAKIPRESELMALRAISSQPSIQDKENPLPNREYPWGNNEEEDTCTPDRANYDDTSIGSTSAVGCFPFGYSPYGAQDMSGNVWEWTRSLHGDYPYPADESERRKRENLSASSDKSRVLRGGAFNFTAYSLRCSYRSWDFPFSGNGSVGFRIVVSPSGC